MPTSQGAKYCEGINFALLLRDNAVIQSRSSVKMQIDLARTFSNLPRVCRRSKTTCTRPHSKEPPTLSILSEQFTLLGLSEEKGDAYL